MSTSYPPPSGRPGLSVEDHLTDLVRQLRMSLGPAPRVIGRISADDVLSNVLHVLEGRVMIDERGRLHPLCKHTSDNVRVVCQCMDCGNVITSRPVPSIVPPEGAV